MKHTLTVDNDSIEVELLAFSGIPVVYFISDGIGHTKVGVTANINARLSTVQVGNPYELRIMHLIECEDEELAYEVENEFHMELSNYQYCGEWFDTSKVISALIGQDENGWDCQRNQLKHRNYAYECTHRYAYYHRNCPYFEFRQ